MEEKTCSTCGETKAIELFRPNRNQCRVCWNETKKRWKQKNKYKVKKSNRKYVENNYERVLESNRKSKQKHKEKIRLARQKYREKNREKLKEQNRKYYTKNKELIRIKSSKYYQDNKERIHLKNREREQTDHEFRIRRRIAFLVWESIKKQGGKKDRPTNKYGINTKAIYEHLGEPPQDGKQYHIDHILPLSAFNLLDPEMVRIANLPENLQWLEASENVKKGDRHNPKELKEYIQKHYDSDSVAS